MVFFLTVVIQLPEQSFCSPLRGCEWPPGHDAPSLPHVWDGRQVKQGDTSALRYNQRPKNEDIKICFVENGFTLPIIKFSDGETEGSFLCERKGKE